MIINLALKAIDKSIELVKLRQKNKIEYFDLVIEPLFTDFQAVAKEYFDLFSKKVPDPFSNDAEAFNTELLDIRGGYLQARVKVTELVDIYKKSNKDDDVCIFFISINEFFYGQEVLPSNDVKTIGHTYIDLVTGVTVGRLESPEEITEKARAAWKKAVGLYGALKVKYKLPV